MYQKTCQNFISEEKRKNPFYSELEIDFKISFSFLFINILKNVSKNLSKLFVKKSSRTKTFSKSIYYMFCLYHFSVKCIIKKNDLPPHGPLNHIIGMVLLFYYEEAYQSHQCIQHLNCYSTFYKSHLLDKEAHGCL